jgi:hypothetical protein
VTTNASFAASPSIAGGTARLGCKTIITKTIWASPDSAKAMSRIAGRDFPNVPDVTLAGSHDWQAGLG